MYTIISAPLMGGCLFRTVEPEVCNDYFSRNRTRNEFLQLSFSDQYQVYKCGLKKRPALSGLGLELASQGREIIPTLENNLLGKRFFGPSESGIDFLAVSEVLKFLARDGRLYCDDHIIERLKEGMGRRSNRFPEEARRQDIFDNLAVIDKECILRK